MFTQTSEALRSAASLSPILPFRTQLSHTQISLPRRGAILATLLSLAGALGAPRANASPFTPAGTVLTATAQATYTDSSFQTVDAVPADVTVGTKAVLAVGLTRTSDSLSGMNAYACTVENDGNYTGDLSLAVSSTSNTSACLVRDTNANGVLDPGETEVLTSLSAVAPGQAAHCLLVVKPSGDGMAGQQGTATLDVNAPADPTAHAEAAFAANYVRPLNPVFTFRAPEPLNSSPTVLNGVALVGSDMGVLYAVKALGPDAGTLAWRYPTSGNLGGAIRGRVATDGAYYYFTANNGCAYCLDKSGQPVWVSQVVPSSVSLEAMPVVMGDTVTIACGDGRLRRLSKGNGQLVMASLPMGSGGLTTPAVPLPGELWVGGSDGSLYSLNDEAGFTILASRRISSKAVSATPFVDYRTGVVLSASPEGNVYALMSHSDQVLWGPVALSSPIKGSPWVDSRYGFAYFAGTDNTLNALNMANGAPIYGFPVHLPDTGGFSGTPVVIPVYGVPILFAASTSGRMYGISTQAPKRYAQFDPQEPGTCFTGSPAVSGTGVNDVVVAASTNGCLYGFALKDALS